MSALGESKGISSQSYQLRSLVPRSLRHSPLRSTIKLKRFNGPLYTLIRKLWDFEDVSPYTLIEPEKKEDEIEVVEEYVQEDTFK